MAAMTTIDNNLHARDVAFRRVLKIKKRECVRAYADSAVP
jgi:hypothetical protein